MNEVDKNYVWFKENLKELLKKYKNKYIVISNQEVIFSCTTMEEAVNFASELDMGNFIIQECSKEEEKNIQVFHTRAIF